MYGKSAHFNVKASFQAVDINEEGGNMDTVILSW